MSMQTQLEQNRHIIHDFVVNTLAVIPNDFGRLTYITSLRDLSTGRYEHSGLAALYPAEAIQQALKTMVTSAQQVSVEVGFDVGADAGVVLASTNAGAHVRLVLTWSRAHHT